MAQDQSFLPSEEEIKTVNNFTKTFLSTLKTFYPHAEIHLEGSTAKGTWVAHEADVDIYILSITWMQDF